jgi:FKBP-type peptidyl-prolyl cis-trans isomerase
MKVVIIGVGVAAVAAGAYFFYANQKPQGAESSSSAETSAMPEGSTTAPSSSQAQSTDAGITELKTTDVKEGTGATAEAGKTVVVHYTGTLTNGTKFDSSKDRNEAFTFQLGGGQVIKGWDVGIVGMKVGGVRNLTIPPEMGYGSSGAGTIPPNSVLNFEVELLEVK